MAEKIIKDLRETGNESLDSLVTMLENFKKKQNQSQEEIKKLKKLILLKDDEIHGLDEDIFQLKEYCSTAKDKQEAKVDELLNELENNKKQIRRLDKLIVDQQQKNDVS